MTKISDSTLIQIVGILQKYFTLFGTIPPFLKAFFKKSVKYFGAHMKDANDRFFNIRISGLGSLITLLSFVSKVTNFVINSIKSFILNLFNSNYTPLMEKLFQLILVLHWVGERYGGEI